MRRMRRRGGGEQHKHKPSHAVKCNVEVLLAEHMEFLQQCALFQCERHGCVILRALTAGQADAIHCMTHLGHRWITGNRDTGAECFLMND